MFIDFYTANDTDTGIMVTVSELGHSLILGLEESLTWVTPKCILWLLPFLKSSSTHTAPETGLHGSTSKAAKSPRAR